MSNLRYTSLQKNVLDLFNLFDDGQLNLEPGFQRQSVWNERDREFLIDSIIRGYPLPSIFLYRRQDAGHLTYDVIDGKQRIESLLMFAGKMHGRRFDAWLQLPGQDSREWIGWRKLVQRGQQHLIAGYQIQCIEVEGDLSDIIDVFVRINSTGKALTRAERRHARYYNSLFLKKAASVAEKLARYFERTGVVTKNQRSRMKHIELVCELMLSAHTGTVVNKKAALDGVMAAQTMTDKQVKQCAAATVRAINRISKMFPSLKTTRFKQLSDFYTLAVLIIQFEKEGKILINRRSNQLASDLLTAFSTGVDQVREKQKKMKAVSPNEELYRDYLITVLEATDAQSNRERRASILRGLLGSLFEAKVSQRVFSKEQRRILWNSTSTAKCQECNCSLTWEDFTIDHIKPYSKGGRTALDNAAIMCKSCNSSKGNRKAS